MAVFGAAVRADGRPSPALARRIGFALAAARAAPDAPIFCSGAAGAVGPSEATVMARELAVMGVASARLVLDEDSRDTLQSAVAVARLVRQRGLAGCVICSDRYHIPRIRMLLWVLGVRSVAGPKKGEGARPPWRMVLREAAAFPYDLVVMLARRRGLRARIAIP